MGGASVRGETGLFLPRSAGNRLESPCSVSIIVVATPLEIHRLDGSDHDPVDYKIRDLGNWIVNEKFPEPNFYGSSLLGMVR
ncbi:MAG: hypothetical protein O9295_18215 [Microcystis sp. LE18-22.4A]|nr:hypothetical protein [Microcystis sp. LE18-22.4A]MCZ8119930.1 hypothetical protein [Microcystis sp. LE18-22.4A]